MQFVIVGMFIPLLVCALVGWWIFLCGYYMLIDPLFSCCLDVCFGFVLVIMLTGCVDYSSCV